MNRTISLFSKMMILIVLILAPVILLFVISNKISVSVLQEEVQGEKLNQLSYFGTQMDAQVEQIRNNASMLLKDPDVQEFATSQYFPMYFDYAKAVHRLEEKIFLQISAGRWQSEVSLFFPGVSRVISTVGRVEFSMGELKEQFDYKWRYRQMNIRGREDYQFVSYLADPFSEKPDVKSALAVVQVSFSSSHMKRMLEAFGRELKGEPFLYYPQYGAVTDHEAVSPIIPKVIQALSITEDKAKEYNRVIKLDNIRYLVSVRKLQSMDAYLIHYVPFEEIVSPMKHFQNLFYIAIVLLLVLGLFAVFMLYRNVQRPLKQLIKGLQHIKRRDFAVRIRKQRNDEFGFVIDQFNQMAEETQELIEKVYTGELHLREATLKQLQSQINPHFLYNCLYYIKNKAGIGEKDAVIAMALSLGEYFRYTTRTETQTCTLEEEIGFVMHYLRIQDLRMQRFQIENSVPLEMYHLQIPRLILQPFIENAIIHGIERKSGEGMIRITGQVEGQVNRIVIEDSGAGMSSQEIDRIHRNLQSVLDETMGCGIWNVYQRMLLQFGSETELVYEQSSLGGVKVVLEWKVAVSYQEAVSE
ncbi:sensor histidine kinase [Paenibacillus gansuensis]|uniref:Sensor histidine kinase n=1 Tax=Paenibacillus gansuensis TaxID=306542 RepID=A0ABW5P9K2_9BACL